MEKDPLNLDSLNNIKKNCNDSLCPIHGLSKDAGKMCTAVKKRLQEMAVEALEESARDYKLRILLIDDDVFVTDLYGTWLKEAGYEVIPLQRLENDPVTEIFNLEPHLIISDIMRPEISSLEVLKSLRRDERTANIPFVFLSNSLGFVKSQELRDLEVLAFITKAKIIPSEFIVQIVELMDKLYPPGPILEINAYKNLLKNNLDKPTKIVELFIKQAMFCKKNGQVYEAIEAYSDAFDYLSMEAKNFADKTII
ncbi:MAG: response regulator, partial [Candidatus Pacebacteria bacterium]|nr:response regulator [Candidatus Paceibacterota bacterium]